MTSIGETAQPQLPIAEFPRFPLCRLRLHEEVPIQLGFSPELHKLCGCVSILLVLSERN